MKPILFFKWQLIYVLKTMHAVNDTSVQFALMYSFKSAYAKSKKQPCMLNQTCQDQVQLFRTSSLDTGDRMSDDMLPPLPFGEEGSWTP